MENRGKKKFVGKSGKGPRGKAPHGKRRFKKDNGKKVVSRSPDLMVMVVYWNACSFFIFSLSVNLCFETMSLADEQKEVGVVCLDFSKTLTVSSLL